MKNRGNNRRCYTISYFTCDTCGTTLSVPRMKGNYREKGHMKDIWCPKCKKVVTLKENRYCDYVRNALGEIIA